MSNNTDKAIDLLRAIIRQCATAGRLDDDNSLLDQAYEVIAAAELAPPITEPTVFHPTNLGLTKEQIIEMTADDVKEATDWHKDKLTIDDISDAEAERFVCLYYDTLIECAGRGDDFTADAIGTLLSDWVADVVKLA